MYVNARRRLPSSLVARRGHHQTRQPGDGDRTSGGGLRVNWFDREQRSCTAAVDGRNHDGRDLAVTDGVVDVYELGPVGRIAHDVSTEAERIARWEHSWRRAIHRQLPGVSNTVTRSVLE